MVRELKSKAQEIVRQLVRETLPITVATAGTSEARR
ncbi:hypothetical protein Desgi_2271 [Desulfoscipio gibsoniae DSM 7213]|uniref:Uncharacterized protein n=1 Tax=Desulfoscipio gibsoniae DSM 7213 TaxID=767817 RepID=R4KGG7_9FIRM|nr:hypothetical protein Desgi_2271 [Desulfoscipio gibsoniae DSM 7213]